MDFKITPSKGKESAKVVLEGELTIKNATELKTHLQEVVAQYSSLTLSVTNITAIDLAGIQLLYSFKNSMECADKKLEMEIQLPDEWKELLSQSGFYSVLDQNYR